MKVKINIFEKINELFQLYNNIIDKNEYNSDIIQNDHFFKTILQKFNIKKKFKNKLEEIYTNRLGTYNKIITSSAKNKGISNKNDNLISLNKSLNNPLNIKIDNIGKWNCSKIKETMFKKIALKCHPDRSKKYSNGSMFTKAREHYDNECIIGLIYFCTILDIDTVFIKLDNKIVYHLMEEIRILIEKIILIDEIKNK